MKCPFCNYLEDKVVDSRSKRGGMAIRRRRECLGCGSRFTTYEYVEETSLMVRKQDGRIEAFDRAKLKRGINLALVKRHVSAEQVETVVNEIEDICHEKDAQEVQTSFIGEIVMNKLRQLDDVAYIRFASVYRKFQDLGAFKRELDSIS